MVFLSDLSPSFKGREIAKLRNLPRIDRANYKIEVVGLEAITGGVQALVKAFDRESRPIGFGRDGRIETERFRIFNPPVLVPDPRGDIERMDLLDTGETQTRKLTEDPQEALLQVLEHAVSLVGKPGAHIRPGSVGHTTSTFFPSAGAVDPCDGVFDRSGVNEVFSTIRAGNGVTFSVTPAASSCRLDATTTSNQYSTLSRCCFIFDTSAIPSLDIVSSATFSIVGNLKANALGSPDLHICGAATASNSTLAASDFQNTPHASFASMAYASFSTAGYNDFVLDVNGIADIIKGTAARTKFSAQLSWDQANSFTGAWASAAVSRFGIVLADTVGTTSDPQLVAEHVAGPTPISLRPQQSNLSWR